MVKMKVVIMEGENISSIKRLNENYKKTLFLFKSGFYFIKKSKFNTASIVIRMFATAWRILTLACFIKIYGRIQKMDRCNQVLRNL